MDYGEGIIMGADQGGINVQRSDVRERQRSPNARLASDITYALRLKSIVARAKGKVIQTPVKIGRNETCPCGSGQKYKRCCING